MKLEYNGNIITLAMLQEKYSDSIILNGLAMKTPNIDEGYWLFRVAVSDEQAIVAFPKFMTFGIGFQKEKDWNTNAPYTRDAEIIYNHIKHNKCNKNIRKEKCIKAINMIQKACTEFNGKG